MAAERDVREKMPSVRYDESELRVNRVSVLKRRRAGHAASLTRLRNELEMKMSEGDCTKDDEHRIDGIKSAHSEFMNVNDELMGILDPEDNSAQELLQKVDQDMQAIYIRLSTWRNEARNNHDNIRLGESATSHTSGTHYTGSSSSSVRLLKARAAQAKVELKLKLLQIEQNIEREREELRHKSELAKAVGEVEEAQLDTRLEEELLSQSGYHGPVTDTRQKSSTRMEPPSPLPGNALNSQQRSLMNPFTVPNNELMPSTVPSIEQVPIFTHSPVQQLPTRPECHERQVPHSKSLNPFSPDWRQPIHEETVPWLHEPRDNAYEAMASAVREGFTMPKPEILTFSGDPAAYYKFIRCFDANIGDRVADDRLKLSYLIQFCKDEAKQAIEDCVIQDPTEGYGSARSILLKRYGRPHTIARAHITTITNGPTLKSNDNKGLSQLSMQMDRCLLTLKQMGYAADLNNCDNLLKIVRRLPMQLRGKWVNRADSILESGLEPTFSDLAIFVERCARVTSNMYGLDLAQQYESTGPKIPTRPVLHQRVTTLATSMESPESVTECMMCAGDHNLDACLTFQNTTHADRKAFTRKMGLCDNCLKRGHRSSQCYQEKLCSADCTVRWKHNALLHPPEFRE